MSTHFKKSTTQESPDIMTSIRQTAREGRAPFGEQVLRVVCEHDDLQPVYATSGAAAFDLKTAEDITLDWLENPWQAVRTGLRMEIPDGYELQIRPRSGLACKGLIVMNSPGTIDSDYRGELKVLVINLGLHSITIERGMRIAQMVICPVAQAEIAVVTELDETERGSGGFGSTGV